MLEAVPGKPEGRRTGRPPWAACCRVRARTRPGREPARGAGRPPRCPEAAAAAAAAAGAGTQTQSPVPPHTASL